MALQRLQGRFMLFMNDVARDARTVRLGDDRDDRAELLGARRRLRGAGAGRFGLNKVSYAEKRR